MSYCRWSSDDYQCDVYVWADVDGTWRVEVAGNRWVMPDGLEVPDVRPASDPGWAEAWVARQRVLHDAMDAPDARRIDLPDPAGGHHQAHPTPGAAADALEALRSEGFNVPQYAIDGLRAEHATDHPEEAHRG